MVKEMAKEKLDVRMSGIKRKDMKDGGELVERFVVSFDVTLADFDKAVQIAKDLEQHLENNLKGQKVL